MLKKIIFIVICMAVSLSSYAFSASDKEIIKLARQYESQSIDLTKHQNVQCFEHLINSAINLSYIPYHLRYENKGAARMMVDNAIKFTHSAVSIKCKKTKEIRKLNMDLIHFKNKF